MARRITLTDEVARCKKIAEDTAVETLYSLREGGALERDVREAISDALLATAYSVIGLKNDNWSRTWEVDKNSNKELSVRIKAYAESACDEWLQQHEQSLPSLSASQLTALKRHYQECLKQEVEDKLSEKAAEDAKAIYEKIVLETTKL